MDKHTPGPWTTDKYGQLRSPSGKPIDVQRLGVCLLTNGDEYPEARANARLIAAAPELLEAAIHALRALRSNPDSPMTGSECLLSMAIVKATGENQ